MSQAIQEAAAQGASLASLCQMAGISRICYYRGLSAPKPAKAQTLKADILLRQQVRQVALEWSCYGYRRVTHELKRQGISVNHKCVLRLMREENLVRQPQKRFVATTNSDHRLPVYPNLAADMDLTAPDQLWVSDMK